MSVKGNAKNCDQDLATLFFFNLIQFNSIEANHEECFTMRKYTAQAWTKTIYGNIIAYYPHFFYYS